MSTATMKSSEAAAIVATVDPQTVANVAATTDWVDMSKFGSVLFVAALGDMASETIDFKLQQATDSSGTGAKDLVTATQLAAHATNNDNDQVALEARGEDCDVAGGFGFVRGRLITGGATGGPACVIGIGLSPRYGPASDNDLASVVEIASA